MTFYRLNEDKTIKDNANYKYAKDCLETDKKIVRGFDGILRFEEDTQKTEYLQAKTIFEEKINNNKLIAKKKLRLEELRKDIVQELAGLIVENIEDKKVEYRTLLNEVRVLQGKEPREIVSRETI